MSSTKMVVVAAAAAAVATAAVVNNRDGVQWQRCWGYLMAAAAFDSVQRWLQWAMAAALDNDKVAGRCRHNNQIEVMAAAGGNIGHWHGYNWQWCLMVWAIDDKTTGNGCSMDTSMDFGMEMVWQWHQRLLSGSGWRH